MLGLGRDRGSSEVMSGLCLQRVSLDTDTPDKSSHPLAPVAGRVQAKVNTAMQIYLHSAFEWEEDKVKKKCFRLNSESICHHYYNSLL
jgi:hypothetical protein